MSNKKTLISSIKWISSVSQRFSRVDRNGRSAVTSKLATLGICFGVMTLIVVMSIMNGFQMSFIDAIMELSSFHVKVENVEGKLPGDAGVAFGELVAAENLAVENAAVEKTAAEENLAAEKTAAENSFLEFCAQNKYIKSVSPFYEAQTMMAGAKGRESSAIIRAIDPSIYSKDDGFRKELRIVSGRFNLAEKGSMVIGSSLARNLGLKVGSTVNLLIMSGGSDVDLFSEERVFTITGIFTCGYATLNSTYSFINIEDGPEYFGESAKKIWGVKLKNSNDDMKIVSTFQKSGYNASSWRNYNKAFFGALRIEKNMLLLLVALIFVVVAINIYNGMRRLVFERRSEIAILSALGAGQSEIKAIFIFRGFLTGAIGAFFGVILGLLISVNSSFVFNAASKIMYWGQYIVTFLFNHQNLQYIAENSTYSIYANIPARIFFSEVFFISIFGVLAPLFASWAASKNVLKMTVAEVLHNE